SDWGWRIAPKELAHARLPAGLSAGCVGISLICGLTMFFVSRRWNPSHRGLLAGVCVAGFILAPLLTVPVAQHFGPNAMQLAILPAVATNGGWLWAQSLSKGAVCPPEGRLRPGDES